VVEYIATMSNKTHISKQQLIDWLGISSSKYYQWQNRLGAPNQHNGHCIREHWILPQERQAIIKYCRHHTDEGYRRLTYMMIDEDIVYVSPSTTYRVLKQAGLLSRWNTDEQKSPKRPFVQPTAPHEQWHIDIKYVNVMGTFLFFIGIIDGYSRYIVNHELRSNMTEYDVELTLQRAKEKYPGVNPRVITDNGPQFISKDFAEFIRDSGLKQIRTSIANPQANGKIEAYFKTLSRECLRRRSFIGIEDARKQIAGFVDRYNNKRLHSSLGYLRPRDYLYGDVKERFSERQRKLDRARIERRKLQAAA
jgi:putative transposase